MKTQLTFEHQGAKITIDAPEGYVFSYGEQPRQPKPDDNFIEDLIIGYRSYRFIIELKENFTLGKVYRKELLEVYKDQIPSDAIIIYSKNNTGHYGGWDTVTAAKILPESEYKYWCAVIPAKK